MKSNVETAIENFINGCWKKVDEYYKEAIYQKNIYIYMVLEHMDDLFIMPYHI